MNARVAPVAAPLAKHAALHGAARRVPPSAGFHHLPKSRFMEGVAGIAGFVMHGY